MPHIECDKRCITDNSKAVASTCGTYNNTHRNNCGTQNERGERERAREIVRCTRFLFSGFGKIPFLLQCNVLWVAVGVFRCAYRAWSLERVGQLVSWFRQQRAGKFTARLSVFFHPSVVLGVVASFLASILWE